MYVYLSLLSWKAFANGLYLIFKLVTCHATSRKPNLLCAIITSLTSPVMTNLSSKTHCPKLTQDSLQQRLHSNADGIPTIYRAIVSRNFIADKVCSMQLCMSHIATLSHKQALIKLIGQYLFMRQSRNVRHAQLHTANFVRDKVARHNRAIKSQVWHRSKCTSMLSVKRTEKTQPKRDDKSQLMNSQILCNSSCCHQQLSKPFTFWRMIVISLKENRLSFAESSDYFVSSSCIFKILFKISCITLSYSSHLCYNFI